jgi:hypothetical protein
LRIILLKFFIKNEYFFLAPVFNKNTKGKNSLKVEIKIVNFEAINNIFEALFLFQLQRREVFLS